MRLILLTLGLALAAGIIVSRTLGKDTKYTVKLVPAIILLLLAMGLCVSSLMVNVSPDHIAVVMQNGKVDGEILNSGWNLVSPRATLTEYDIRSQNDTIYKGVMNENVVPNDTLETTTAEGKVVKLGINLNYAINPANAVTLYKEAGHDFKQRIVQPLAHNLLRRNAIAFGINEIKGSSWTTFEAKLSDDFKREFNKHGLDVSNVMVRLLEANTTANSLAEQANEHPMKVDNMPLQEKPKPVAIHKVEPKPQAMAAQPLSHKHKAKPQPAAKEASPVASALPLAARVKPTPITSGFNKVNPAPQKPLHVKKAISAQLVNANNNSGAAIDTTYKEMKAVMPAVKRQDTVFQTTISNKYAAVKDSMAKAIANPVATIGDTVVPLVPSDVANTLAAPANKSASVAAVQPADMPLPAPAPLDSASYEGLKDFVRMHPGDSKRIEALQSVSQNNYYTTNQVLGVNRLLSKPESKLEFAKMAYLHTTDRKNYGLVAAALDKKSRKQLVKYIVKTMKDKPVQAAPATNTDAQQASRNIERNNNLAKSIQKNTVPADCKVIDEMKLSEMKKRIVKDNTDNVNAGFIKTTVENNCFTTDQVLRIVKLLKTKQAKLDFAKMAYARTVDRERYRRVADNLKPRYRRALDKYIMQLMATAIAEKPASSDMAHVAPAMGDAAMSTVEPLLMSSISNYVQQHNQEKAKLDALHSLVAHNNISTAQVAQLMQLLQTEAAKLQWAKDAYIHTVDKGVYNVIINTLNPDSQKALQEYMAANLASK